MRRGVQLELRVGWAPLHFCDPVVLVLVVRGARAAWIWQVGRDVGVIGTTGQAQNVQMPSLRNVRTAMFDKFAIRVLVIQSDDAYPMETNCEPAHSRATATQE